jgi:hypothetical protein
MVRLNDHLIRRTHTLVFTPAFSLLHNSPLLPSLHPKKTVMLDMRI